jgi:hypothetical protein
MFACHLLMPSKKQVGMNIRIEFISRSNSRKCLVTIPKSVASIETTLFEIVRWWSNGENCRALDSGKLVLAMAIRLWLHMRGWKSNIVGGGS